MKERDKVDQITRCVAEFYGRRMRRRYIVRRGRALRDSFNSEDCCQVGYFKKGISGELCNAHCATFYLDFLS